MPESVAAAGGRPLGGVGGPRFREGCRDALSVVIAYIPLGLALGTAMATSGVDQFAAWSSSWLICAGAAQLVTLQMLGGGSGAVVIILTALVINARHLLYSASIAPYARDWPKRWRWALSYALADPMYALAHARYERKDGGGSSQDRLQYMIGVSLVCWAGWQVLIGAGVLLGDALPAALPLTVATPLTFLLLLLPSLKTTASYAAAGIGGLVSLAASGLPLGLNLAAGAAAGIAAGLWREGRHA
ncbi:AzlC family ABC transporter permease [Streptomyces sp. NPDC057271]|uniref:AzlC family ABC transporter permease n=1 Tax=unclassified Streptomyces TaxID=2593676 RepID=UPI003631778C